VRSGEKKSVFQAFSRRGRPASDGFDSDVTPVPTPPERPKIGIALGGGAARGWAHIGVLRALRQAGIVPDIITGTSIGSVVGGCHAAGRIDDLATWACSLTKKRVFGYLDVSFAGAGLITGGRLGEELTRELGATTIETLPTQFAAIATEIRSGHEIWLTRGRLVEAMRASYALPGIFEPVRIGGRWLMDGALVNPVPVTAARALGARIVIAVNLSADGFGRGTTIHAHGPDQHDERRLEARERVKAQPGGLRGMFTADRVVKRQMVGDGEGRPGLSAVMVEAFNITQDRITRARLAGDPPDVLISPRTGSVGLFDFHRAADSIKLGEDAAMRALDQIQGHIEASA
jgi:NTE family protein